MGDYFVKIYGAPYTFDLYKGTEQELNYFQTFDNGGTEPVKMTIHRLANGWIAYNYLRYGFVTSGGRTGSFFGMSVVFNRMYCSDFTSIYDLFDGIYQALSKKAVLFDTPDQGKPKYKIRNFADAENVMQWIEGVVRQNLQDGLANDLHPAQFPQSSNSGMEKRLTPKDGNSAIVEALKKYAMVSISPLYAGGNDDPVRIVPPEVLMELSNNIYEISEGSKKLSDKVDAFQKDFKALKDTGKDVTQLGQRYQLLMGEISRVTGRTDDSISKIQQWFAIKPAPLNVSSLTTPGDKLSRLRDKLYALSNTISIYRDEIGGSVGPGPGPDPGPGPELWPWWKIFIDKHRKSLIAASAALVLIIGALVIFYPKDKHKPEVSETEIYGETHMQLVREAIGNAQSNPEKWCEAYGYCDSIVQYNKDIADSLQFTRLNHVKDTMGKCQTNYRNYCVEYAKPENNIRTKEEAIQWCENELKKVGLTSLSQEDKNKIAANFPEPNKVAVVTNTNTGKTKNNTNTGSVATSSNISTTSTVINGTIKMLGEGVKNNTTVVWNKDVQLRFETTDKTVNVNEIKWYIDETYLGSGNNLTYRFQRKQTGKIKCFVNGNSAPSATTSKIITINE